MYFYLPAILHCYSLLSVFAVHAGYIVPSGGEEQLEKLISYEVVTPYQLVNRERRQAQTNTQVPLIGTFSF